MLSKKQIGQNDVKNCEEKSKVYNDAMQELVILNIEQ